MLVTVSVAAPLDVRRAVTHLRTSGCLSTGSREDGHSQRRGPDKLSNRTALPKCGRYVILPTGGDQVSLWVHILTEILLL